MGVCDPKHTASALLSTACVNIWFTPLGQRDQAIVAQVARGWLAYAEPQIAHAAQSRTARPHPRTPKNERRKAVTRAWWFPAGLTDKKNTIYAGPVRMGDRRKPSSIGVQSGLTFISHTAPTSRGAAKTVIADVTAFTKRTSTTRSRSTSLQTGRSAEHQ